MLVVLKLREVNGKRKQVMVTAKIAAESSAAITTFAIARRKRRQTGKASSSRT